MASFRERLAAAIAAHAPTPSQPTPTRSKAGPTRASASAAASEVPRSALETRGVSLPFLMDVLGQGSTLTPGQLVHGDNTTGPPDDWRAFDAAADPYSLRALTAGSLLSVVETAAAVAAEMEGDEAKELIEMDGLPLFGTPTHFVSYSWHGITCGDLLEALQSVAKGDPIPPYFWIDVFAVAQNDTPEHDLHFEGVIRATGKAVAVMHPWASPRMLTRCWCLHELGLIFEAQKPVEVALVPGAAATSFRRAIKDNFGSLLMTILASVDSQRAQATKPEDKERIFAQIEGSIGFDELNIRVITLLNEWLRKQHAEVSGTPWEQRDARSQVLDFMGRMAAIREEVKSMGLDPTIQHRADDGVLFIGGEGGIILGCTDASAYVSAQPPSDAPAHDETADTSAAPRDAPSRTTKRARCNDNGAGTAALGEAVGGDDAAAMEAEEPIPLDEHIPERLKDGRVCERYSATLVQTDITNIANKFYKLQLVECEDLYYQWVRYGRVGEAGATQMKGPWHRDDAINNYCKQFKSKSGCSWDAYASGKFVQKPGKYTPLELTKSKK